MLKLIGKNSKLISLQFFFVHFVSHIQRSPGRFSMTIQSLCTAIRSQLHFSQITAWSDLLKSTSPHDPELKLNPRVKASLKMPFKPKLDILYRVRPYSESTSTCFSAPPIVHNFPETLISDHLSVKVSLKSLPRMKSIPRLYDLTDMGCALADLSGSPTTPPLIVDDRPEPFDCHEKGKHRCTFDEESPTDDAISHRDKQLMKYKKRIMRRDKKKRNDELANQKPAECSSGSAAERSDAKHLQKLSMTHFRYGQNISFDTFATVCNAFSAFNIQRLFVIIELVYSCVIYSFDSLKKMTRLLMHCNASRKRFIDEFAQ